MSTYIHYEIWLFCQSVLLGALLRLSYVVIQAFRKSFPHSPAIKGFFDILYWLIAGLVIFARIYQTNQGTLRNFLFTGLLTGAVLAHLSAAPVLEKICVKILKFPVDFVKKILKKYTKRLLFLGKRCKILDRQSVNQYKNCTRSHQRAKRGRKFGKIREKQEKKENRL